MFRAAALKAEREHNLLAWHTWHGAALPRMKTLPKLEKLQFRQHSKRQMTPDEMWAVMLPMTYSKH